MREETRRGLLGMVEDEKSHYFSFIAGCLELNYEVNLIGAVTAPTQNMNYIKQNLLCLLKKSA